MILGGSRYILPIIKSAHLLGVHVISADYLPDNLGHKYSDEYCNVSIVDKEAVFNAAQKLKIDGILSFACDPGVVTAAYVAEKMALPSCGPYESVCTLQNKGKFRKFMKEHKFNVPMAGCYRNMDEAKKEIELFHWPVIVKPADSAGSKGVTKVDKLVDLEKSINSALFFSHSQEFVIEDFLEKIGHSSDSDCFSVNGELKIISFNSQRFDKYAQNPYTPAAYSWPASMASEHKNELSREIQRLLGLLNMQTSIYNIETRECADGKAYIMECSPRGGGNRLAECLRYATGVDMIEASVKAALGLPVELDQKPYSGYWAEVILHSNEEGIFDSLWIAEEIHKNIVEKDIWVTKGDIIHEFSGANEAIGTLIMKYESGDQLNEVMNNISKYIQVRVK